MSPPSSRISNATAWCARCSPVRGLLLRKLRTLFGLPVFTSLWLVPVWCLLLLCRLAIIAVPMRYLYRVFGQDMGVCPWVPLATPQEIARARDIRRTIGLAASYSPSTSNCYPQAVAARLLMGLYGLPYAIHFGLRRDGAGRQVAAHAWLVCGPVPVTGGDSFGAFTVVRSFASRTLSVAESAEGRRGPNA